VASLTIEPKGIRFVRASRHNRRPVDFDETLDALMNLEDVPVALDTLITKPAEDLRPEDLRFTATGCLRLDERELASERPVDEAAWWVRAKDHQVFRVAPDGHGVLIGPKRFRSAEWSHGSLVIDTAALRYTVVPLVRPSGKPLAKPEI
jgi:hypothetical protein